MPARNVSLVCLLLNGDDNETKSRGILTLFANLAPKSRRFVERTTRTTSPLALVGGVSLLSLNSVQPSFSKRHCFEVSLGARQGHTFCTLVSSPLPGILTSESVIHHASQPRLHRQSSLLYGQPPGLESAVQARERRLREQARPDAFIIPPAIHP